jgi:predicted MFS family arabinose efflux permease
MPNDTTSHPGDLSWPRRARAVFVRRDELWSNAAFNRVWAAESVAFFGVQVALFVLPLVAVLSLGASPAQLGVLGAAFFAPSVILGLIVGVWADRYDRRRMLLEAEVVSTLAVLAIPVAAALGYLTVELLYVVSFLLGTATVHFNAPAFAILPGLVGQRHLVGANNRLQFSLSLARVLGPWLGGLLVQWLTAPLALAISALAFVVCGAGLFRLQLPSERQRPAARMGVWAEISAGLRFVAATPAIRATAGYSATSAGCAAATLSILPLYATDLGLAPAALGLVLAAGGVGGIVGALVSGGSARRLGTISVVATAAIALATTQWLVPLAGSFPALATPLLAASRFVLGLALVVYAAHATGIQQSLTPDVLQGRMYSTIRFVANGTVALGAVLGGLAGQALGLWPATALAAAGATLSLLWLILSPVWWGKTGLRSTVG